MGEIKTNKRWLTKTVEGTEAIGDARITIRGKKKWAVKYEVLVDSQEKRVFETKGSFIGVLMDMKKDEHAKEGCELLKTMAEKISDPKRSLTGYYNDRQLQCLAALMEGERTLEEVVEATNLETTQASKALMDLQATGLSYRCEKKGELPRRYTLSTAGKQMTDLLVEYEKFHEIRRNLRKKKKDNGQPRRRYFNENELTCLVLLEKDLKTVKEIAEATELEQEEVVKALKAFETWGVVEKRKRAGDKNWRYTLTETGKHHIEVLAEDEKFQVIKVELETQEITEPSRRIAKHFSKKELFCLAALEDGPKSVEEVAEITGLGREEAEDALKWLTSGGVLRTEGEINSKDCKYALDTKGEKYVKLLLKEEKFLEIQKKMGDAQ